MKYRKLKSDEARTIWLRHGTTGAKKKELPDDITEIKMAAESLTVKQLLLACRLVSTGGEAKRMAAQSAVTIDGEKITDPNAQITPANGMIIQVGKRKFAKLKIK